MKIQLSDHFSYSKLLKFTVSSIAMMIFTSIYSVVDGFFVSNFAGKTNFTAVNLIMPVLMILGTVGFMFGTGGTALVALTYGTGDKKKANEYFSLFVYTAFIIGAVLAALGLIFIRPIAGRLGATGELLEGCVTYGRIILVVTLFSGLTNMILDAVLVIGLPQEYKLAGAAAATAIAQFVGGVIPLIYFLRKNSSILRLGRTKFYGKALVKASTNIIIKKRI